MSASSFKQTNDMPVRLQFYGRAQKFALEAFYSQFSAGTKFDRSVPCKKIKSIVFCYDYFFAKAAFRFALFDRENRI